jgi:hypothetical protein
VREPVRLDVDALGLDDPQVARQAFDVSPGGGEVVVGVVSGGNAADRSSDGDGPPSQLALAVFDTADGSLDRVLLEDTGPSGIDLVETVRWSPDGDEIVAVRYTDRAAVVVLDAATGERTASVFEGPPGETSSCSGRIGISEDGRRVQCGSTVVSVPDGTDPVLLDDENRYAATSFADWAWTGTRTARLGYLTGGDPGTLTIRDDTPDGTEQVAEVDVGDPPRRNLGGTDGHVTLSQDGSTVVVEQDLGPVSLRTPRRDQPGARVVVVDVAGERTTAEGLAADPAPEVAWAEDGSYARLTAGFGLAVLRLDGLSPGDLSIPSGRR